MRRCRRLVRVGGGDRDFWKLTLAIYRSLDGRGGTGEDQRAGGGTMERRERRVEEKDEERVKENEGQQKGRVKVPQPLSRFLVVKARALAPSQGLTQAGETNGPSW